MDCAVYTPDTPTPSRSIPAKSVSKRAKGVALRQERGSALGLTGINLTIEEILEFLEAWRAATPEARALVLEKVGAEAAALSAA